MMTKRDLNRLKGQIMRGQARGFGMSLVGDESVRRELGAVDAKVAAKIVQNAIKPLVGIVRKEWRSAIKSARTSRRRTRFHRRYGGISLRSALAKNVRSRTPSGSGKKILRGYVSLGGGASKHGKRGEAVTNAAQAWWFEFGTAPHDLAKGSRRARRIQLGGARHPGTRPSTSVRARMKRLEARALRFFEAAIKSGLGSGGERIKAEEVKRLFGGGAR